MLKTAGKHFKNDFFIEGPGYLFRKYSALSVFRIMSASLWKAHSRLVGIFLCINATQNNVSSEEYPEHTTCVVHVPPRAETSEAPGGSSVALYNVCAQEIRWKVDISIKLRSCALLWTGKKELCYSKQKRRRLSCYSILYHHLSCLSLPGLKLLGSNAAN